MVIRINRAPPIVAGRPLLIELPEGGGGEGVNIYNVAVHTAFGPVRRAQGTKKLNFWIDYPTRSDND